MLELGELPGIDFQRSCFTFVGRDDLATNLKPWPRLQMLCARGRCFACITS